MLAHNVTAVLRLAPRLARRMLPLLSTIKLTVDLVTTMRKTLSKKSVGLRWTRGLVLGLGVQLTAGQVAYGNLISDTSLVYDGGNVKIDVKVYNNGSTYLWQYTVQNNGFGGVAAQNGFSGFELYLPTSLPEIANVTPNASSTPPWDIDCCSGHPEEWDIRNSEGNGIMPGNTGVFSFTTDPREIAVNNSGWFHSWANNVQVNVTPTPGMIVPWVPGLQPVPDMSSSLALLGFALGGVSILRRKLV